MHNAMSRHRRIMSSAGFSLSPGCAESQTLVFPFPISVVYFAVFITE